MRESLPDVLVNDVPLTLLSHFSVILHASNYEDLGSCGVERTAEIGSGHVHVLHFLLLNHSILVSFQEGSLVGQLAASEVCGTTNHINSVHGSGDHLMVEQVLLEGVDVLRLNRHGRVVVSYLTLHFVEVGTMRPVGSFEGEGSLLVCVLG